MKNNHYIKTKGHKDGFADTNLTVKEWEVKSREFCSAMKNKPNHLSIKLAKNCLFSRRNGHQGTVIFGFSVVLRVFGRELI